MSKVGVAIIIVLTLLCLHVADIWGSSNDEAIFVASVNVEREARGLRPLTVDVNMRASAREYAAWMAENNIFEHASDITGGAPAGWTKMGENIGRGGSVPSVMGAFMVSPGHAANVLDPSFTRIGVGVVWDDGILYTVHRFAAVPSDNVPKVTPKPIPTATLVPTPTLTPLPTALQWKCEYLYG